MSEPTAVLLDYLPKQQIINCYLAGRGKEIESGKFVSPESSSALVANVFGLFLNKPTSLTIDRLGNLGITKTVSLERELRFPWRGGLHPWLDVVFETDTHLIGVESKRYEPYRDKKNFFSEAFQRDVWGAGMDAYKQLRDELNNGYLHLDPVQLTKHAFALRTQASKCGKKSVLIYLYAEPDNFANGNEVLASSVVRHRLEVGRFTEAVRDSEVSFFALTYVSLLQEWANSTDPLLSEHANTITTRFDVGRHP